ncbi:hypothetical protein EV189_1170 [Motilibacter rhizosphaerae]|uniref:Fibronectin type-III domain-containing protein n=1 Tax=Motilibacter rhizosphaerae TaxID=598652 RepID=A0A4Q7NQS7_9ACTN|nr:Ig-like domain-containing protein [Motilibacter rhizosphaerae]RZS89407.1 hypothetical protein EV189_1170 [Motilibacter rhizosphaerae]
MTGQGSAVSRRGSTAVLVALLTLVAGLLSVPGSASAVTLGVPTGLSPDSSSGAPAATKAQTDLLLSWAPVSGATGYEVQVSDDEGFDPDVLGQTTTTTSWALPATVPAGDYVWRVRATAAGAAGDWSTTAAFTRSWETAPGGVQVLGSEDVPTVRWDALPGASFYEVEFSNSPYTDEPAQQGLEDTDRYTCFTQHPYLAPYGVATGKEALPGDEQTCVFGSAAHDPRLDQLTKDLAACDATYQAAIGGLTNPTQSALDGVASARATCYAKAQDTFANTNPLTSKLFFPQVDSQGQPVAWYVRVRGRNGTPSQVTTPFAAAAVTCTGVWHTADGKQDSTANPPTVTVPIPSTVPTYVAAPECSSWSTPVPFGITVHAVTADITTAVTAATVQPAVAGRVSSTPLFTWAAVPGAAKYRVYVGRTRDLRSSDHVWETETTSLMPYGTLPDSARTYWGVQACGWRSCGPITPLSFVKRAATPVAALASTVTATDADVVWRTQSDAARSGADLVPSTDSDARAYQVQVDVQGTTWAKPPVDVTVDAARLPGDGPEVSRATLPLAGLADGTYLWRVRAVDESGFAYPWSYGTPFLRDVTAPTAKLLTSTGFQQGAPLQVAFSEPVSTGTLAVTSGGAPVAGTLSGRGTATWSFTPKGGWVTGQAYAVSVMGVTDPGGNSAAPLSAVLRASTVADASLSASAPTTRTGRWTGRSASDAIGRSYLWTTTTAGRISTQVSGSSVRVYLCRSPHSGTARISVDRKIVADLDLYRSFSGCGLVWQRKVASGTHQVAVTATGRKDPRSRGTVVGVDAIATS